MGKFCMQMLDETMGSIFSLLKIIDVNVEKVKMTACNSMQTGLRIRPVAPPEKGQCLQAQQHAH